MPRHQLRERRMKTYNLETIHLVFRGHWLERGRELVAAQDVSIRRCVYLFVSEIVGSNSAPATKNFVARKLNGFRAFLLPIDMTRIHLSLRRNGAEGTLLGN